jgi:glycosyltransferase involved in cell wall biosynthesis
VTSEIARIASETGLADRLILPGRVPHDEVERYYSLIDIAPFPRKPDLVCELVSPLKPLEALAMEKTVIVSSVAPLAEMIADGKTGLVFEKGNPDSLTATLDRALSDAGLRARLGEAGRKWVAAERTWATMAARVAGALAGNGSGPDGSAPPDHVTLQGWPARAGAVMVTEAAETRP